MKVDFVFRNMKSDAELRSHLTSDLQALARLLPIAHAHISLARQHETTPPFQAVAMLAVAGPDIHAAARDHTSVAAWRKVLTRLREQIEQRRNRQVRRKQNLPPRHRPNRNATGRG